MDASTTDDRWMRIAADLHATVGPPTRRHTPPRRGRPVGMRVRPRRARQVGHRFPRQEEQFIAELAIVVVLDVCSVCEVMGKYRRPRIGTRRYSTVRL